METTKLKKGDRVKVWSLQSWKDGGFLKGEEGTVNEDQEGGSVLVSVTRKVDGEDITDHNYEVYREQCELIEKTTVIKLTIPVVASKYQIIINSKDSVIELHEDYAVFKVWYEYKNDTGEEKFNRYESAILKKDITQVEWAWDKEDEKYELVIRIPQDAYRYNCLNMKHAILLYDKVKNWLYI